LAGLAWQDWIGLEWLGLIWSAGYAVPAFKELTMTEVPQTETTPEEVARPLTQLEIFFIKLGGITAAAIVFLVCSVLFLQSMIESKIDDLSFLKGGHVFWETVEKKVDALANGNDIPPERKAKIVASIKKIADRYRPYFEAAAGSPPHN
jgi:hypothetical protein